MSSRKFSSGEWAVILGGSSGFGLASARKLASQGLNICIVHRDRRGAMSRIEPEFDKIRGEGVSLITHNKDALNPDVREEILEDLRKEGGCDSAVRVLLHSIAFGNLKLIAPEGRQGEESRKRLADELGIKDAELTSVIDRLFVEGHDGLQGLTSPPEYSSENLLDEEDMARTIESMGTNLLAWTQGMVERDLFSDDARVLGLTSEGNKVAWKGYAAVGAAKVALESVSRSIAVEMASLGVRSNIIQAGVTDTPALRMIPGNAHLKAQARIRNPFNRLTTPEDVANVVYLLSVPESSWINGAIIRVDGGESISGASR